MIIRTYWIDGQAIVPKQDFELLLELARKSEPIDVHTADDELTTQSMMRLVETNGAFEFWNATGEDIYSEKDGGPI